MLRSAVPLVRSLPVISRLQPARCMSGASHTPATWKTDREVVIEHHTSMDNMPVPSGSWQENYNKRNVKLNTGLAVAFLFFSGTLFMTYRQGILYLHDTPSIKKGKGLGQ